MDESKLSVGVIGLGKFGMELARTLLHLGHRVVGVDGSEARVQLAQELIDTVYKADATNVAVLRSLHFEELDCVVVSVGRAMDVSLSITLNLQDLHVSRVWVKASNAEHRKILQRLGVEKAILPEYDAAVLTAHQLGNTGVLDVIPRYGDLVVQEVTVNAWDGKTLRELDLISKHEVIVIGVHAPRAMGYAFVPPAHTQLKRGDVLLLVGKQTRMQQLEP